MIGGLAAARAFLPAIGGGSPSILTAVAALSSRRPRYEARRKLPSLVQPRNSTSATRSGAAKRAGVGLRLGGILPRKGYEQPRAAQGAGRARAAVAGSAGGAGSASVSHVADPTGMAVVLDEQIDRPVPGLAPAGAVEGPAGPVAQAAAGGPFAWGRLGPSGPCGSMPGFGDAAGHGRTVAQA